MSLLRVKRLSAPTVWPARGALRTFMTPGEESVGKATISTSRYLGLARPVLPRSVLRTSTSIQCCPMRMVGFILDASSGVVLHVVAVETLDRGLVALPALRALEP